MNQWMKYIDVIIRVVSYIENVVYSHTYNYLVELAV